MADFIYDIETYPNFFSMAISDHLGRMRTYEVSSRKNELREMYHLLGYLRKGGHRMVGFNNMFFDYPVLHRIVNARNAMISFNYAAGINAFIYATAKKIIDTPWNSRWYNVYWPNEEIVPQVDLLRIHHYDNTARSTGLKDLEVWFRMDDVRDLPVPAGTYVEERQMDEMIQYNMHDVHATLQFYQYSRDAIKFREDLQPDFRRPIINYNDGKIGKEYLIMELERSGAMGEPVTPHPDFKVADVISDRISFRTGVFSEVLEHFRGLVVEDRTKDDTQAPDTEAGFKNGKGTLILKGVFEDACWTYRGIKYKYGAGGLHGSVEKRVLTATEDRMILDVDVTSYYPNLVIGQGLYPAHMGENFTQVYADFIKRRARYAKGTPRNAAIKLGANSIFGDTNNRYSKFYHPPTTLAITINGQLFLSMLIEALCEGIAGLEVIQANTDGITVIFNRTDEAAVRDICRKWEEYTSLSLEGVEYERMFVRDVNNYIAVDVDGNVKRKGCYVTDVLPHQDPSERIVAVAAGLVLLDGWKIPDAVRSSDNIHDYITKVKARRVDKLVFEYEDMDSEPLQRISRFIVSEDGAPLVKIEPRTVKGEKVFMRKYVCKGRNLVCANRITDVDMSMLDYEYYEKRVEDLTLCLA